MNFPRHGGHDKVKTDQYWAFGYSFLTLDDDAKHHRRQLLEWYPLVAQWAVLVVLTLFQLVFFLDWVLGRGLDYERPRSPSFNKRLEGQWTWLKKTRHGWTRMMWWLRKDVTPYWNWGTRGEWIGAAIWTLWLLYLCIVNTGEDYLHLTKRFGIIGASQLPLHYLLAMRAPYSPIQWLTRLSHEQLKSAHEILGRIIFFLFVLHGSFYLNFFVLSGWLGKRIKDKDVIFGIISILLFTTLSTTALEQVRRRNYRIFYTSHIIIANLLVIPLALHVSHIWLYVGEIILVNSLHLFFRFRQLKIYDGTIKLLPGTNLVQIRVPLTSMNSALTWKPGQHVYLSLPTGKAYTDSAKDQFILRSRTNPLSVASIPVQDKEILLVAKTLNGNTKKIAELARSLSTAGDAPTIPIGLEGPYGQSARLPDLSDFDRVLLVAGGVGATYIMPVYRSILEFHEPIPGGTTARCIWAVQKLGETQWAFPAGSSSEEDDDDEAESEANGASHDSSAVEVFVTRLSGPSLHVGESGEEIELAEDDQLLSMEEQMEKPPKGMVLKAGRPKMKTIVDDVFSKGSKIAVICCGPKRLTEGLKKSVEQWVVKGYDVYWHDESFSW